MMTPPAGFLCEALILSVDVTYPACGTVALVLLAAGFPVEALPCVTLVQPDRIYEVEDPAIRLPVAPTAVAPRLPSEANRGYLRAPNMPVMEPHKVTLHIWDPFAGVGSSCVDPASAPGGDPVCCSGVGITAGSPARLVPLFGWLRKQARWEELELLLGHAFVVLDVEGEPESVEVVPLLQTPAPGPRLQRHSG